MPWTLPRLVEEERLSAPPEDTAYAPPGDATTAESLGYLHANCGHCHNPRGTSWPDTQMVLRLEVEQRTARESGLYRSVVSQALQYYRGEGVSLRVNPGEPASSALIERMQVRGPKEQMPPLATEQVDEAGVALVSRWISSLTP